MDDARCSECPDLRVAQSLCTSCNRWLCYPCTDLHQHLRPAGQTSELGLLQRSGGPGMSPETAKGSAYCAHAGAMCSLHKQEPLELFCETCDLLTCNSCHLPAHKDHRVVHAGKALEDQRWLFENLMVRAEEKRSILENTAKQIEDRLHSVKVTQRRAENQIKMAKMIMMNELNKRANLLIEQLENVSSNFKRRLEDQLQGAIEMCSTLDQVQNFISWATTHHQRSPLLFSKDLMTYQMQHVLEPQLHLDSWAPLKIKFNWDASFWTKQISTLGQLTVEGGSCLFSESLGHRGILRPQPVACIAVPALCRGIRDPGCAYQSCCQPQLCCLHCVPPQPQPQPPGNMQAGRDKSGQEPPSPHPVSCAHSPPPPYQPHLGPTRQRAQQTATRQGEGDASSQLQLSPTSASAGYYQSQSQSTAPPAALVPPPQHPQRGEQPLDGHAKATPELPQLPQPSSSSSGAPASGPTEAERELQCGAGRSPHQVERGSPVSPSASGEISVKMYQADGREQLCSDSAAGWVPSAFEMSALAEGSLVESQSLSGVSVSRKRRSQRGSTERRSPSQPWPPGAAHSMTTAPRDQAGSAEQCGGARAQEKSVGLDGVLSRGVQPGGSSLCLTTYKTEPENVCVYTYDSPGHKRKTKYRIARKTANNSSSEAGVSSKVPVVCLERLKILVSRCPPHGHPHTPLSQDRGLKPVELIGEQVAEQVSRGDLPLTREEDHPTASEDQSPEPPAAASSPGLMESPWLPDGDDCDSEKSQTLEASSTDPEPVSLPESESEPQPETVSLTDLGSEDNLGLEPLKEWDPSSQGDSHAESELESEQPAETELSSTAYSEPDLVSEPDSTAEVAVRLEPESAEPPPPQVEEEEQLSSSSDSSPRPEEVTELLPPVEEEQEMQEEAEVEAEEEAEEEAEMENEDFCAVCLIGGELLCCDRCPKVYHLSCHVPSLLSFPNGDWVCSLCRDVQQPEVEYDCENTRLSAELKGKALPYGLSASDLRKCEKLTLLIFSHALSAPFHEPVSPLARHYYQIIKRPMDLSVIRGKLNKSSHMHYFSPEEFVADVFLMFRNCAKFNYPDSEMAQAGCSLEAFFSTCLREVFPSQAFSSAGVEESDSDEYEGVEPGPVRGFPWPDRREQSHRKRKRRHSLNSRRQHF
ncbi:tripartite motif-containing protein 66 [Alosa alosa]|uniref:tripartite motif-containing protein 66 n=1 Tax=Alosa alosa TaxID=278164 RepID=UPI00201547C1|nr:tripartite motif-containing protein 66 [Alosa alosa]